MTAGLTARTSIMARITARVKCLGYRTQNLGNPLATPHKNRAVFNWTRCSFFLPESTESVRGVRDRSFNEEVIDDVTEVNTSRVTRCEVTDIPPGQDKCIMMDSKYIIVFEAYLPRVLHEL